MNEVTEHRSESSHFGGGEKRVSRKTAPAPNTAISYTE